MHGEAHDRTGRKAAQGGRPPGSGLRRPGGKQLAVLAIAGGLIAAWATGVLDVGRLEDAVRDIGPTLGAWTYPLVAALAFLETAALIGLVAPGELTVVIGGVAAAQGGVDVIAIFLVAWAAATAGDLVSYALGRRLGRPFLERHGPRLGIGEPVIARAEALFERHGGKLIVVGRFVGVVRALAPFLAGVSRMSPLRFAAFDAVGAGLWAGAFTALGWAAAANIDRALDVAAKGKLVLLAVAVAAVATVAVRRARAAGRDRAAVPAPHPSPVPAPSTTGEGS